MIDIIIPVYNGMPFLPQAVGSVLAQNSKDFRLYLVDDVSTDEGPAFLAGISDERVHYIRNPRNLGLYASLAQTVRLCTSDWICILMQDDYLYPSYLDEMTQLIRQHPDIPLLWATEDLVDESGKLMRAGEDTRRKEIFTPGPQLWRDVLHRGCIWTISGSMTRRQLFLDEPFDGTLPHRGDYEWLLRTVRRHSLLYYQRPLFALRRHSAQASTTNLIKGIDIRETVRVFNRQFVQHKSDLPAGQALGVVGLHMRIIVRRSLGMLLHGRFQQAGMTFIEGLRLLALMCTYQLRSV